MAPPAKKLSSNGMRPYERDSKSKKNESESVQRELNKLREKSKDFPKTVAEESDDSSSSDEEFFDPEGEDTEGDSKVDGEEEETDGETDEGDEEGNDDGKTKGVDKGTDEDSSDDD